MSASNRKTDENNVPWDGAKKYQVFARKYRPQNFEELLGQEHLVRTIRNAILQGRLANAYLFIGPRGVGKTSVARILAKSLNCKDGPTVNPCGKCQACEQIEGGNSLDVLEIDGASNNGVEQIREIRENSRYLPSLGLFRIYLIDEVHMLSPAAFNALLKTLEEPPPHVKFLLATTESHKVPPTVLSRCQRFDLRPIKEEVITAHLLKIAASEGFKLSFEAASVISRASEGGMRDAESMLDQMVSFCDGDVTESSVLVSMGLVSHADVKALAAAIVKNDAASALGVVEKIAGEGKDMGTLLEELSDLFGEWLLCGVTGALPEKWPLPDGLPSVPSEPPRLAEVAALLAETKAGLRFVVDKKMPLEMAVLKSVDILHTATVDEVLEALGNLKN